MSKESKPWTCSTVYASRIKRVLGPRFVTRLRPLVTFAGVRRVSCQGTSERDSGALCIQRSLTFLTPSPVIVYGTLSLSLSHKTRYMLLFLCSQCHIVYVSYKTLPRSDCYVLSTIKRAENSGCVCFTRAFSQDGGPLYPYLTAKSSLS